jgi:hypothetical protein
MNNTIVWFYRKDNKILVSMFLSLIMCLICVVFFTYMSLNVLICGSLHFVVYFTILLRFLRHVFVVCTSLYLYIFNIPISVVRMTVETI